jgi:hypothetical protein
MDSVEDYARQWAKCEKENLDTLSEWVKSVRCLVGGYNNIFVMKERQVLSNIWVFEG